MGTSTRSKGPKSGVPFDPPWLNNVAQEIAPMVHMPELSAVGGIAPRARFAQARQSLSSYLGNGHESEMRKAVKAYVHKGLGGRNRATSRMRIPIVAGARMLSLLQSLRDQENPDLKDVLEQLRRNGATILDLAYEIVKHVVRSCGSVEEERTEQAMSEAMTEFFLSHQDADIMNLTDAELLTILELFLANEIFKRVIFDIGQIFENDKIPTPDKMSKLDELKAYIRSVVTSELNSIYANGCMPNAELDAARIIASGVENVHKVFEEA